MTKQRALHRRRTSDANSRQAILEAAAEMMATKGFSGTSISMICAAAGCPPSSLYWHFASKDNLLAEVVRWKADRFFSLFPRGADDTPRPMGAIDDIGQQVARALQDDPLFLRFLLLLGLERQDMPREARKSIEEVRALARAWWQSLLEARFADCGTARARAVAVEYAEFGRSVIDGAFFAWDFGDGPDLGKVFRQLMILLSALNEKMTRDEAAGPSVLPASGAGS